MLGRKDVGLCAFSREISPMLTVFSALSQKLQSCPEGWNVTSGSKEVNRSTKYPESHGLKVLKDATNLNCSSIFVITSRAAFVLEGVNLAATTLVMGFANLQCSGWTCGSLINQTPVCLEPSVLHEVELIIGSVMDVCMGFKSFLTCTGRRFKILVIEDCMPHGQLTLVMTDLLHKIRTFGIGLQLLLSRLQGFG